MKEKKIQTKKDNKKSRFFTIYAEPIHVIRYGEGILLVHCASVMGLEL